MTRLPCMMPLWSFASPIRSAPRLTLTSAPTSHADMVEGVWAKASDGRLARTWSFAGSQPDRRIRG